MFVKKIHHIEVEVAIRTSLNAYEDENNGAMNSTSDLSIFSHLFTFHLVF